MNNLFPIQSHRHRIALLVAPGHGLPDAEDPRFVARGCHDAPLARSADGDRALRWSVGQEAALKAGKLAKKPRSAGARQNEMLMPISGKKPAKGTQAKKKSAKPQSKLAYDRVGDCRDIKKSFGNDASFRCGRRTGGTERSRGPAPEPLAGLARRLPRMTPCEGVRAVPKVVRRDAPRCTASALTAEAG